MRFVSAYLVKCETVAAACNARPQTKPDFTNPDLWPRLPNSSDLNPVDYRIRGVLQ